MLTAEGVGRLLNPNINMWELARPLIEEWMRENRGPEAQFINDAGAILSTVRRIPALVSEAERVTRDMAEGGVRLHPQTVRQMLNGWETRRRSDRIALWVIAALLAVIAVQML